MSDAVELLHAAAGVAAPWELLPDKARAAAAVLTEALGMAREAAGDESKAGDEPSGASSRHRPTKAPLAGISSTPEDISEWFDAALRRDLDDGESVGDLAARGALWRLVVFLSAEGVELADVETCRITYPYKRWRMAHFAAGDGHVQAAYRKRSAFLTWIQTARRRGGPTRQIVAYVRTR